MSIITILDILFVVVFVTVVCLTAVYMFVRWFVNSILDSFKDD